MIFAAIVLLSFAAMEGVAWASHRYIMHGFGWAWHASHHPAPGHRRTGWFEKNDLFGLVFSVIAISGMLVGVLRGGPWKYALAIGIGMTLYGAAYLFLHDMLVHKRFGVNLHPRSGYLRAVMRTHRLHHARRTKEGCHAFGFLIPLSGELREPRSAKPARLPAQSKPASG
jgi:beta-carotene 3-hydroxylase